MTRKPARPERPSLEEVSFEDALARLEAIVQELEEGQIGLSQSLQRYEEGVQYLQLCHRLLQHAERRIELLQGVDAVGNPVVAPFDEGELNLAEKARARGQRRSLGSPAVGAPGREASGTEDPEVDAPEGLF